MRNVSVNFYNPADINKRIVEMNNDNRFLGFVAGFILEKSPFRA